MSVQNTQHLVWKDPWHFIATGFGLGTLKYAPGTWGTLAGVFLYGLLYDLSLPLYVMWVILAIIFGIWLCGRVAHAMGGGDPASIVWDEMVGYWITLCGAPRGWGWMVLGFVLFRFFDIFKMGPVRKIDSSFTGGLGIMLDDVLAGIFAWVVLQGIAFFYG